MTDQAEQAVLSRHRDTIEASIEIAQQVTATWPGDMVQDSAKVTAPLDDYLDAASLLPSLLELLYTAVDALDGQLQGRPVPAPPYLVVTSRGPLCRGTLTDGRRVIVRLDLFAVSRRPRKYRFPDPAPNSCLTVEIR
jgi:hypothetical protein